MYIEVARSFSLIGNGVHVPEKKIKARAFFFSLCRMSSSFVSCHVQGGGGMLTFHFNSRLLFIAISFLSCPPFVVWLLILTGQGRFVHIFVLKCI